MPVFRYHAKKGPTEQVSGKIEAVTQEEAVEKLSDQGLLPVRLEEVKEAPPPAPEKPAQKTQPSPAAAKEVPAPGPRPAGLRLSRGIGSKEITLFGKQLGSLLKSGVPILRSMWIISEQTQNPVLKDFLQDAQQEINNGKPLSSVFAKYPKLFPPIYLAMVKAGEDSGTLQEALARISEYRQKQDEVVTRIRTAMAYPILMALTGIGTVIFMMSFVIPRLSGLFESMGEHLPLPTRILITISHMFQKPLFWVLFAALLIVIISLSRSKAEKIQLFWSRLSLKIWFYKDFVMKSEMARFSRTLELLIRSGIPIIRSLEIATPVVTNRVLRAEFLKTVEDVHGGGGLGQGLKKSGLFPLFMTNLIMVGEESGKLDESVMEIALFYEAQTDEQIKILTSLIEPLMILVMGAVVGFIVIAMLLPMFELNLAVK